MTSAFIVDKNNEVDDQVQNEAGCDFAEEWICSSQGVIQHIDHESGDEENCGSDETSDVECRSERFTPRLANFLASHERKIKF